jgi:hypothetical protein
MIFRQIENHSQNAAQIQTNVVHMGIEEIYPGHGQPFNLERGWRSLRSGKREVKSLFKLNTCCSNVISVGKQIDGVFACH